MLRLPGKLDFRASFMRNLHRLLIVAHVVQTLDLTFLMMTNAMIVNDLMPLLLMLAILLWTFGNGMYHIMYE